VLACGALGGAACEDDPPPAPRQPRRGAAQASASPSASAAPSASAGPSASAAPSASASPAAAGSALPTGSAAPSSSAAAGPPAVAFDDFSGPVVKPAVAPGARAWVVVPVSGGWEAVKLAMLTVLEIGETDVVVEQDARRYRVPGAFVAPALPAAGLTKGDPVMASANATRVFGRVVSLDGAQVGVRFKFAGSVETRELKTDEVVKLDGRPILGAPVVVRVKDDVARPGQLIHQSAGKSWVITAGRPRPLSTVEVEVMPAPPKLAVGDAVLAPQVDKLMPGKVVQILDEGLQLEIKWDGGEDTATSTFESIVRAKK
jgi:hypothetical protein